MRHHVTFQSFQALDAFHRDCFFLGFLLRDGLFACRRLRRLTFSRFSRFSSRVRSLRSFGNGFPGNFGG